EEAKRKDSPTLEGRVVPAQGRQGYRLVSDFPGLSLEQIEPGAFLVVREIGFRTQPLPEPVVNRREVQNQKIDAGVTERIDPVNGFAQRTSGPRRLADLVGVLMHEPIGIQFARELLLATQDLPPDKLVSQLLVTWNGRKGLDRQQTFAKP